MRNRRNKNRHNNNWNNQKNNQSESRNQVQKKVFQFDKTQYMDYEAERNRNKSIQELKSREIICPKCNQPITDIASAINDKQSGVPCHFDCIMNEIGAREKLGENERIAYIGQGRFGVLYFENPRDQRKFTIKRIIEAEDRDTRPEWCNEISGLFSQVQ